MKNFITLFLLTTILQTVVGMHKQQEGILTRRKMLQEAFKEEIYSNKNQCAISTLIHYKSWLRELNNNIPLFADNEDGKFKNYFLKKIKGEEQKIFDLNNAHCKKYLEELFGCSILLRFASFPKIPTFLFFAFLWGVGQELRLEGHKRKLDDLTFMFNGMTSK